MIPVIRYSHGNTESTEEYEELSMHSVLPWTAYSMKLVKKNKHKKADKFDMIAAQVLLLVYVVLNIWFISRAGI